MFRLVHPAVCSDKQLSSLGCVLTVFLPPSAAEVTLEPFPVIFDNLL